MVLGAWCLDIRVACLLPSVEGRDPDQCRARRSTRRRRRRSASESDSNRKVRARFRPTAFPQCTRRVNPGRPSRRKQSIAMSGNRLSDGRAGPCRLRGSAASAAREPGLRGRIGRFWTGRGCERPTRRPRKRRRVVRSARPGSVPVHPARPAWLREVSRAGIGRRMLRLRPPSRDRSPARRTQTPGRRNRLSRGPRQNGPPRRSGGPAATGSWSGPSCSLRAHRTPGRRRCAGSWSLASVSPTRTRGQSSTRAAPSRSR